MALRECPICKEPVSDDAAFCQKCGHPFHNETKDNAIEAQMSDHEKKNSFRTGTIIGLIGSAGGVVILFISCILPALLGTKHETKDTTTVDVADSVAWLVIAAFLLFLIATTAFLVGFIRYRKAGRIERNAISGVALACSIIELALLLYCFNIAALCFAPLVLWEPVLQTIGSYKMLSYSLKTNE